MSQINLMDRNLIVVVPVSNHLLTVGLGSNTVKYVAFCMEIYCGLKIYPTSPGAIREQPTAKVLAVIDLLPAPPP
jgi:hypothetical protein